MADYTENMNLILPKSSETYNVEIANTNNKVIDAQMANKVNKETGKGLSANDFTDGYKNKLDNLENYDDASVIQSIEQLRNNKVNKETGKGLSSNDFTNEHKSKLEGLENYDDTEVKSDIQEIKSQYYTKEEIEKVIDKKEVEGTEIHIEDAKEFNMIELEIEGKSEQKSRSGKNYFDASKINNKNIVVSDNGKTITMPVNTSGNGYATTSTHLDKLCPDLKVGDVVTLRFNRNLGYTYNNYIYLQGNVNETWIVNTSKTITQEMLDDTVIMYGNSYNNGETEQVILTDFSIMKSTETDTTWEQYGASPSPEFPSPIENVEGWNLYNQEALFNAINWTKDENGYYTGNSRLLYLYLQDNPIQLDFKENTQYRISLKGLVDELGGNLRFVFHYTDGTNSFNTILETTTEQDFYQISSENKTVSKITVNYTTSKIIHIKNFQITEGSERKPYAPFNSLVIKDVGNNLFDNNKVSSLNKLSYENGIYSASDNDTRTPLQYKIQQYTENNTFLGATTQVTKVISNIGRYYFTGIKAEDAAFVKIANNGAVREFTLYYLLDDIAVGEKFTVVLNVIDTTIGASKFKDVMLLKGEITEADYEKHKSQTEYFPLAEPLRGLPNEVKDTIKEDGIHIRVGTGVFQAVTQLYESSNGLKYGINLLDTYGVNTENSNINILCDKAIGVPLPRKENIIYITNNRTLVIFGSADDTVETFNEKFAGAEYQYELAEEVIEPFTPEQQTAWNNVKAMKLFEGVNNITVNATIKPNIRLTYAQDLKKRIERIEQLLASETVSEEVQNG